MIYRRPQTTANIKTPSGQSARRAFEFFSRWRRTQRIRTAAAIPVVAVIVEAGSTPVFLQIAVKAAHLRELGMSDRAIAQALDVTDACR
jgi:hypothetical protein